MKELTNDIKNELLLFVLNRADVAHFNESIKRFSVQHLYSRYKRELKSEYPELMPTDLHYSIVMCEVFKPYRCDEFDCPDLLRKIDSIKRLLPTVKRMNIGRWMEDVVKHDSLVREYSEKLQPQNDLIKLYKQIRRKKKKLSIINPL